MKSQISVIAFLLLSLGCGDPNAAYGLPAAVSPIIYQAPTGELPSSLYEVQVAYQGAMRNSFVYSDTARQVITEDYRS